MTQPQSQQRPQRRVELPPFVNQRPAVRQDLELLRQSRRHLRIKRISDWLSAALVLLVAANLAMLWLIFRRATPPPPVPQWPHRQLRII